MNGSTGRSISDEKRFIVRNGFGVDIQLRNFGKRRIRRTEQQITFCRQTIRGAYVIVTSLESGELAFKYGWNNADHFASAPLGYWIGVYDVTASSYVWSDDIKVEQGLKMIKLKSLGTTLYSGHEYYINFFVRDSYAPESNVAEVELKFTAP